MANALSGRDHHFADNGHLSVKEPIAAVPEGEPTGWHFDT
jgi:hypothetical protein